MSKAPPQTADRPELRPSLVVGISSRALFDLDDCHRVFEQEGVEAYRKHQIDQEEVVLQPGPGFNLVRKLLGINDLLSRVGAARGAGAARGKKTDSHRPIEVVLISRNSADIGVRIFRSIAEHSLDIRRAAFCSGRSAYRYAQAFGMHLFLSADEEDVRGALGQGVPSAVLLSSAPQGVPVPSGAGQDEVRVAFDGDAVLFDSEAERVHREQGVEAFQRSEQERASKPMHGGPFLPFVQSLQRLQASFDVEACPIRTALVTARSAPAHERPIRTLRDWGLRLDEVLFLGGEDKGRFLRAFGADIFFDDKIENCGEAEAHTTSGHVPDLELVGREESG